MNFNFCNSYYFFIDTQSIVTFWFLPLGVTMVFDFLFFICTTLKIKRLEMQTNAFLNRNESRRHDENKEM